MVMFSELDGGIPEKIISPQPPFRVYVCTIFLDRIKLDLGAQLGLALRVVGGGLSRFGRVLLSLGWDRAGCRHRRLDLRLFRWPRWRFGYAHNLSILGVSATVLRLQYGKHQQEQDYGADSHSHHASADSESAWYFRPADRDQRFVNGEFAATLNADAFDTVSPVGRLHVLAASAFDDNHGRVSGSVVHDDGTPAEPGVEHRDGSRDRPIVSVGARSVASVPVSVSRRVRWSVVPSRARPVGTTPLSRQGDPGDGRLRLAVVGEMAEVPLVVGTSRSRCQTERNTYGDDGNEQFGVHDTPSYPV